MLTIYLLDVAILSIFFIRNKDVRNLFKNGDVSPLEMIIAVTVIALWPIALMSSIILTIYLSLEV